MLLRIKTDRVQASKHTPCGIGQEKLAHVAAYCLREEVSRVTIRESRLRSGDKVVHEEEDMGVQGSTAERRKRRPGDYPPPTCI
jgi:hypothetical protein